MDRIDPSSAPEDDDDDGRMTTASSHYASTYASTYLSTSTYHVGGGSAVSSATAPEPSLPYLPCLSWGWALVSGGGGSVTPILARAWGRSLQLLRAAYPPFDPDADDGEGGAVHWPAFGVHDELETESPVVALSWLGRRSLVYLTAANEFAVVDTVMMTMQERLDFSEMSLVYAEFSLSRGAGASPRRPEACTTFMNSMRSSDSRLLVLCRGEVKQVTILGMKQQIMSLEEGGQWLEALALALDHYESTVASQEDNQRTSSSGSAGRVSSLDPSMLTEDEIWMAELLMRYLILAIENAPESLPYVSRNGMDLAHSHFEMLSGVCIEFCTTTKRLDLLFGPIFRCFYDARYINVFLDVMEAYVLNDRLRYIAPEAMSLFVAHCKEMKDLSTVERCLLHMDCSLMDFHSILSLLKKHSLFTGLFHVYTSGLDDFVSPLEVLMEALFDAVDADLANELSRDCLGGTKAELYGYKALLYLQYCFEGKSFPKGDPLQDGDRLQTLRPELFDLLLQKAYSNQRGHRGSSYPPRGIRSLSYPYMRALAMVDAKLLFGCISNVFDDQDARFLPSTELLADSWQVEIGTDTSFDVERIDNHSNDDKTFLPSKQSIVGCLSSIIMKDSLIDPSSQIGSRKLMTLLSIKSKHAYLDFLATVLAKGVVRTPRYIGEVFVRLTNKKGSSEDEILTLLHALPRGSFELDEILFTVERVEMMRAALFLHQEAVRANLSSEITARKAQHHLDKCVDCFLMDRDAQFRLGVFDFIRKTSSTGDVSGVLRDVILKRLAELIDLDPNQAALLVAEVISYDIGTILYRLKGLKSGSIEFKLLQAVISSNSNDDSVLQLKSNLTKEHHHSYLELLIKFRPDQVYQYLQTHQNNYRLDEALKQCQDCEIADASAYLLERLGDISGSLKLMLESLDERLRNFKLALQSNFGSMRSRTRNVSVYIQQNESLVKEVNRIKQILSAVLDLCERNKNDHLTLDNESGPLLWFHVLDKLVGTKPQLGVSLDSKDNVALGISSVLSEILLMTMQRMITNVPLIDLMKKITKDYSGNALGEFREMLVSMLTTYRSELGICSNAVDVMLHDIRQLSHKRKSTKVKGIFVHDGASLSTARATLVEISPADGKVLSPVFENAHGLSSFGTSQTGVDQSALLQRRLNGRRTRLHHRCNNKRRRGGNNLSLVTVSEFSVAPFEEGRVVAGNLSDAQHIGGL